MPNAKAFSFAPFYPSPELELAFKKKRKEYNAAPEGGKYIRVKFLFFLFRSSSFDFGAVQSSLLPPLFAINHLS